MCEWSEERSVLGMKMEDEDADDDGGDDDDRTLKTRTVHPLMHIMRLIFHGEFYLLPLTTEGRKEEAK